MGAISETDSMFCASQIGQENSTAIFNLFNDAFPKCLPFNSAVIHFTTLKVQVKRTKYYGTTLFLYDSQIIFIFNC